VHTFICILIFAGGAELALGEVARSVDPKLDLELYKEGWKKAYVTV
jgi:hypothetical protein